MWVWIMENKNTVTRVLESTDHPGAVLEPLLVKAGNAFLRKEDARTYGYDEEDVFHFSVDLIKSILEVVFKHEDWQSFAQAAQDGMPRQKSEPATSGNNLASYADVSRAITSLPEDQYNTLVWRYKYNYTFTRIGQEAGITKQGAENRHRAAVNAIQQFLGKRDLTDFRRGYDGRTEPRGSASGRVQVERDYEG
jgi:DNA-directed RNA polymerase specialized sigma subunit